MITRANTIFCVGGGPSLKNFDWEKLNNLRVIAINKAFRNLPNADYIYFSDLRFWNWHREELIQHRAIKVTGHRRVTHEAVMQYRFTGLKGLDLEPGCLRTGNNSGYAAINLAVHLGAKNIVLLGYDMTYKNGSHYHEGYANIRLGRLDKMLPWFESMVETLNNIGVEVLNANKNSAITCFKKIEISEVLAHVI